MRGDPSKHILVTGAGGQLGMSIRLVSQNLTGARFYFAGKSELDVTDKTRIAQVFQENKPDVCIHCAAYTAVDLSEKNSELAFQVNAKGAGLIADACRTHQTFLIHISTDYVYDSVPGVPISEKESPNPGSVYGKSKLEGEQMIRDATDQAIIIRTSWLYSPFGNNFVKTILKLGQQREMIKVVNDQIGSPTYAVDLADAILQIISLEGIGSKSQPVCETFNYCNRGEISWFDFARSIYEISGVPCKVMPVSTEEYNAPAPRPKWSVLSTDKIVSEFNLAIPFWLNSLKRCLEIINN